MLVENVIHYSLLKKTNQFLFQIINQNRTFYQQTINLVTKIRNIKEFQKWILQLDYNLLKTVNYFIIHTRVFLINSITTMFNSNQFKVCNRPRLDGKSKQTIFFTKKFLLLASIGLGAFKTIKPMSTGLLLKFGQYSITLFYS